MFLHTVKQSSVKGNTLGILCRFSLLTQALEKHLSCSGISLSMSQLDLENGFMTQSFCLISCFLLKNMFIDLREREVLTGCLLYVP